MKMLKKYLPNKFFYQLGGFKRKYLILRNFYINKWPYSYFEAWIIAKHLAKKDKVIVIVYDVKSSPCTYGDYLMVVMFARFFVTLGCNISFNIIDGNYRDDWVALNESEKKLLIKDYFLIAESLLKSSLSEINVVNYLDFKNKFILDGKNYFFPFKKRIIKRAPIYYLIIHLLSILCKNKNQVFLNSFLLSKESIPLNTLADNFFGNYITWHVRYSKKWEFHRNMNKDLFLEIYKRLRELHPNYEIMIISDKNGCDYFKDVSLSYGLENIKFSKDFSSSYLGDAGLILGGKYHFMYTGGGISLFAMFSRIAYEFIFVHNEACWSKKKMVSWATDSQIVRPLFNLVSHSYLPEYINEAADLRSPANI